MSLRCLLMLLLEIVGRADRETNAARSVDLLVLAPGDDVQVPLAVVTLITTDQVSGGELRQVVLYLHGAMRWTQGPQQPGENGRLIAESAVVVSLGEETEEGSLCAEGDGGERLGGESFGLDCSDSGHGQRPPSARA